MVNQLRTGRQVVSNNAISRSARLLIVASCATLYVVALSFYISLISRQAEANVSSELALLLNLAEQQRKVVEDVKSELQRSNPLNVHQGFASVSDASTKLTSIVEYTDALACQTQRCGSLFDIEEMVAQAETLADLSDKLRSVISSEDSYLAVNTMQHRNLSRYIEKAETLNGTVQTLIQQSWRSYKTFEHNRQSTVGRIGLASVASILLIVCLPTVHRICLQHDDIEKKRKELHWLSLVAERTSNAVIITDESRRIVWVNEGFTRITGFSPCEAIGCNPGTLLQCDETDKDTIRHMKLRLDSGLPVRTEIINRSKSGRLYWLELDIQPIHDENGKLTGFIAVETEVTERKDAERRIESQKETLHATLHSIGDGVISIDLNGLITSMNPVAEKLTGWRLDECVGLPIADIFRAADPKTGEQVVTINSDFISACGDTQYFKDSILTARDDGRRHIAHTWAPIRKEDGQPEGFILVFRDTSEEYRAQLALQVSEENLRSLMDCAPMLMWTCDCDGVFNDFNRQWIRFRGRTLDQEQGNQWLKGVHPEDREGLCQELAIALKNRSPFEKEYRLFCCEGRYKHILSRGAPRFSATGEFQGFAGAALDVTVQREAESKIKEAAERTELALAGGNLGLWDWDIASGGTVFDSRWASILGIDHSKLTPDIDELYSRIHPEDRPKVEELLQQHLVGNACEFHSVHRMLHASGSWHWIQALGRVVGRDIDGTPRRLVGTLLDVTEQVLQQERVVEAKDQAEAALRESATLLRSLDKHGIISIADRTGTIIDVNDGFCQISGYQREELIGQDHRIINSGVHSKAFWKEVWDTIIQGKSWRGEVCNCRKDGSLYWVDSTIIPFVGSDGLIEKYISIRFDITERKLIEEKLRSDAHTDLLTGLPNRAELLERLDRAIHRSSLESDCHFALFFLDFDRFKYINDSLGHEFGDLLLRQIAYRLQWSLRQCDLIVAAENNSTSARLGGDEFVILFEGIKRPCDASSIADRLLEILSEPYELNGHRINCTVSIGIVTSANRCDTAKAVLRDADTAMYEAKSRGRGCYVVFNDPMRD